VNDVPFNQWLAPLIPKARRYVEQRFIYLDRISLGGVLYELYRGPACEEECEWNLN